MPLFSSSLIVFREGSREPMAETARRRGNIRGPVTVTELTMALGLLTFPGMGLLGHPALVSARCKCKTVSALCAAHQGSVSVCVARLR